MMIDLVQGSITEVQADAWIVNLFEGVTHPGGATGAVDRLIGGTITRMIESGEFRGKLGETASIYLPMSSGGVPTKKVVVVGLGPSAKFGLEEARRAAGSALNAARSKGTKRIATIVHGAGIGGLDPEEAAQSLAEGSLLAAYRYRAMKKRRASDDSDGTAASSQTSDLDRLIVAEMDAEKVAAIRRGLDRGTVLADSVNFARDLVNTPPSRMTPTILSEHIARMAAEVGLECNVLERAEMEALGLGALLGVARGSDEPPKLIILKYIGNPAEPDVFSYGFVGKGVTFDSGGLSLKQAASMETMKNDMAGAAAVAGAMRSIALLKPNKNVLAVAACVENMPSGRALKPGDVLDTLAGITIQVDNTDAEGRLILADAVAYAARLGARAIVDVATLTGAVGIALGDVYSGLIANDDGLVQQIQKAAEQSGERFWRLPSDDEYKDAYKSDVADIKNTGGRLGGAITGGLIIGEFVGDTPWAHLDIAATAFTSKTKHYQGKGATGVAVRTLALLASS